MIILTSFASLLLSFERGSLSKSPKQVFLSSLGQKGKEMVHCGLWLQRSSFGAGKGRGMAPSYAGPNKV